MSKQVINDGETGAAVRGKLNDNFTELYDASAVFTDVAAGFAPASGGGTVNYLRADGAWSEPPAGGASVLSSAVSLTVPWALGGGVLNHREVVVLLGALPASRVFASLAPVADVDDLDTEELGPVIFAAEPGTDQVTLDIAFSSPTSGALKLNLMVV